MHVYGRIMGEMKNFELFCNFMNAKKLENGTAIYLMQRTAEVRTWDYTSPHPPLYTSLKHTHTHTYSTLHTLSPLPMHTLVLTQGVLDVVVRKPRPDSFTSDLQPDLRIPSAGFARAMYEVFLGQSSVVPDVKPEWAKGAKALLESDKIKRDTRKGGSG